MAMGRSGDPNFGGDFLPFDDIFFKRTKKGRSRTCSGAGAPVLGPGFIANYAMVKKYFNQNFYLGGALGLCHKFI